MKKLFTTLLALVACVSLSLAAVVPDVPATPMTKNTNLTWAYADHVLTISVLDPTGDCSIPNYSGPNYSPWYKYEDKTDVRNAIHSVVIADGVDTIGENAFNTCKAMQSVVIPSSVKSIGANAFISCEALTSVAASNVDRIGGNAFAKCYALTSVSIPMVSGTNLGSGAFKDCKALTSFTTPQGVTAIPTYLFDGCTNLKSVTISRNVVNIPNGVFRSCTSLERIVYLGTDAPTVSQGTTEHPEYASFYNVPTGGMLFVPNATASDFDASKWNNFAIYAHAAAFDIVDNVETGDPDDLSAPNSTLAGLMDGSVIDITLTGRTFLRNGDYNTLCLPFALNAVQLAEETNPLHNFAIYEITGMYAEGPYLKFKVNQVSSVAAGKPYLMKYNGEADNLVNPKFDYVTVTASVGQETLDQEETTHLVKMVGLLKSTNIAANENTLFLLAGNQLAWASSEAGANRMRGFRAYFEILEDHTPYYIPRYRNLAPRIVEEEEVATDIEAVENNELQATKVIENGQLFIIKNGVKYNVQGQVISK